MGALPAASPGRQRPWQARPRSRLSYVIMSAPAALHLSPPRSLLTLIIPRYSTVSTLFVQTPSASFSLVDLFDLVDGSISHHYDCTMNLGAISIPAQVGTCQILDQTPA